MIPCDLTVNGQSCPFPAAWLYELDDLGRVLVCERHEPTFGFPEGKRAKLVDPQASDNSVDEVEG